jgi:hypothetical protein
VPPIEVDCRVIGHCPPLFVAVGVTPKFAMIFLSAVTVKLRPFLPVRVPPHASNSSPASPASATRIWMIVE